MTTKNDIESWIWFYYGQGFSIIPLKEKDKRPNIQKWEQYQKQRATKKEIEQWIKNGLFKNIGVICGAVSNDLVVIDIDDQNILQELNIAPEKIIQEGYWLVRTGRGYHIYCKNIGNPGALEKDDNLHIEYRANGGYVVAPPSIHPSGAEYKFLYDKTPENMGPIQERNVKKFFDKLKNELQEKRDIKKPAKPRAKGLKKGVKHGARNDSAFKLACNYRDQGLTIEETTKLLMDWNTNKNRPPMHDNELINTIKSAYKRESKTLYKGKLSSNTWVEYNEENVLIKKTRRKSKDGEFTNERIVYQGLFEPVQRLNIDGNRFYEITLQEKIIGNIRDVLTFMRTNGGVVSNNDLSDCINAIISEVDLPVKYGHSTFGIYQDNGKLELCLEPYCITEEQKRIKNQVKQTLNEELTTEAIQGYIDLLKYWNEYEIYITMAYGVMSPFAYCLKEKNILVPYPFHSSPESGLGKSLVAKIFSQHLYGITSESMGSVYSDFRIADTLDSICGPKTIDEAQKYNWNGRLAEKIKQSAENPLGDKRGSSDKTSQLYLNRLIGFFTGNGFPISNKSELVRFFRIEFDMSKKDERAERNISKNVLKQVRKLRPIGFRLVENELQNINQDINELIIRIDNYGDEIVNNYGNFIDARRPTAWGLIYEGLKAWERICKEYNIKWQAPNVNDFVVNIVKPIELFTFESKEIPVEDFLDWFETFIVSKEGEKLLMKAWVEGHKITIGDINYFGYVITNPILKLYNRATKYSEIKNMGDLARSVSAISNLPINEIYDPRRFKIDNKTKKGVFLDDSIFSQKEKDKDDNNDKKHNSNGAYLQNGGNSVTEGSPTVVKKGYLNNEMVTIDGNQMQQKEKDASYRVTAKNDLYAITFKKKTQLEKIKELQEFLKNNTKKGKIGLSYKVLCDNFDQGFIENCKKNKIIISGPKGNYVFNRGD